MRSDLKNIAEFAHYRFLSSPKKDNKTCWVVVDSREDGVDVAFRMTKEFMRSSGLAVPDSKVEIPYDTLPAHVGFNQQNGRAVFILSQPDHIPTVQTTMTGSLGDLRSETVSEAEEKFAQHVGADVGDDKLLVDAGQSNATPKAPDVIIVDQKYPMWEVLAPAMTDATNVMLTDNVADRTLAAQPNTN